MATQSYTPDNTRSSVIVILFIAAAVALVAMLIGLSEKPEVEAIGVVADLAPADTSGSAADAGDETNGASQPAPGFDAGADADTGGVSGDASLDTGTIQETLPEGAQTGGAAADGAAAEGATAEEGATDATTAAATPIPIATATPEPTAEIAAAVEPIPAPAESTGDTAAASAALVAPITPGTITGAFFTRPDEDEGASVQRNELSLTLNEDGTGSFTGELIMTMPDATQITLGMSGPIRWTTAQPPTPQVEATVNGSYSYDSQIDLDDVTASDAELTISSLGSGSGSLCFPRCFGFTFTPQTGF